MKVKSDHIYYLVEGEPYLSLATEFYNEYQEAHVITRKYALSIHADQCRYGLHGHLIGVKFKDNCKPDDFKKADKWGCSQPKKKSSHFENFGSEKYKLPFATEWFLKRINIPINIGYKYKGGSGGSAIGHPFCPIEVCWYNGEGGIFLLKIPNVALKVEYIKIEHPDVTFTNGEDKWKMNEEGLRKILPEEWDLMATKYNAEKDKVND